MRVRTSLAVPGIIFLVIGCLMFFVSSEITVKVELLPFSVMLIAVLVFGAVLLLIGFVSFIVDRL